MFSICGCVYVCAQSSLGACSHMRVCACVRFALIEMRGAGSERGHA